ncbi:hypothetical protein ACJVQT_22835 [Enterobacter huaxiensis]|uniref:hypothetical protein n=1 Tax=Enterobacter huaxiensis TaxID=2494702 RepID=UPI002175953E|nr:hypothetical protein [Enterobacter huaxiensis]MCS5452504.1 hypothetical protein [Enterobacter huaxiensis]
MEVIYLKPTYNATIGTIRTLKITDANLLIALGFCKPYTPEVIKNELPKKRGRVAKAVN